MIVAALLTALLFISLLGRMSFMVEGMEFEVALKLFNKGETQINIPPVGSLSAHTHLTPVKIMIGLENIDIDVLQQLLKEAPSSTALAAQIKKSLQKAAAVYLLRLVLLGVLGGLTGAALVCGNKKRPAVQGAAAGLCISILLLGFTYGTYRVDKLQSPEYHGALKAAPWVIGLAENAFQKFNVLGEQMQVIAVNLNNIFESIDEIEPLSEEKGDLLVLHVSDIHNNPAAHKFLLQIVKTFPVDLVIDTGDITDYGTPVEGQLLKGLTDLEVPYLFVPGNHDSPDVIKELSRYPQVQVLTGGTVDVQGLRILALADPSSGSRQIGTASPEVMEKSRERMLRLWEESAKTPHVAAVHDFTIADPLVGKVPLILYGHSHQFSIKEESGTVLVCAGTSGAAGIRGLQAVKEIPYSVVLLHFKRNEQNELYLTATDTIKLYNLEKGFTLERKLFND